MFKIAAVALVLTLSLLVSPQITAQDYELATGAPVATPLDPHELGFVNLANGNNHFEIPVASFPERGGSTLTFKWIYDSKIWQVVTQGSNQSWLPTNIPNSMGGWRFVSSVDPGSVTHAQGEIGCGDGTTARWFGPFSWIDPWGTTHVFPIRTSFGGSCLPVQGTGNAYADDSSGYSMYVTGGATATVYAKDGTQVYPNYQDTNGNTYTKDGNGNTVDPVGRTPVMMSQSGNQIYYDVLDTRGGTNRSRIIVTTGTLTPNTSFSTPLINDCNSTNNCPQVTVVTNISFPDGSSYAFDYDSQSDVVKDATLPTGGMVTFHYYAYYDAYGVPSQWMNIRNGAVSASYQSSVVTQCASPTASCQQKVVVTRADRTETYLFTLLAGAWLTDKVVAPVGAPAIDTNSVQIDYQSTTTGCMASRSPCYTRPLRQTIALGNLTRKIEYSYDAPTTANLTEIKEWDWYGSTVPANPLRQTVLQYQSFTNPNIVNRANHVWVEDGSGNVVSETQTAYDPNGNVAKVSGYLNSTGSWLDTTVAHDSYGNLTAITTPGHRQTTFDYDPAYQSAYLTKVTLPPTSNASHVVSFGYDFNSGLLTSFTDQNLNVTHYNYDTYGRPSTIIFPDGGETDFHYPDTNTIEAKQAENSSSWIDRYAYSDGFGRVKQTRLVDAEGDDFVDIAYGSNGNLQSIKNPYRSSVSSATDGTSSYLYDALGRLATVTEQDGSTVKATFSANCVTLSDETQRQRQLCTDGLGRLTDVYEPNPATGLFDSGKLHTSYAYDDYNHRLTITQAGNGSGSARVRTLHYDSLYRLIDATNPETGTICYGTVANSTCNRDGYDADGNLLYRTDANGKLTSYTYDALNRLTDKTYSGESTHLMYRYDALDWTSVINGVGQLVETAIAPGSAASVFYEHDAMGRIKQQWDCRLSNCTSLYPSYATYDLAGNLNSFTYPSGRKITQSYSTAGRLINVNFANFNGTPVSPAYAYFSVPTSASYPLYYPDGSLGWNSFGNSVSQATDYNSRLEVAAQRVANGASSYVNRQFSYADPSHNNANSGNVIAITDNLNSGHSQNFTYDWLNRITLGQQADNTFYEQFSEDPWGDLNQFGSSTFNRAFGSNNQVSDYCNGSGGATFAYDANGNMTYDCTNTYAYDAENHLLNANLAMGGSVQNTYDAEGNRARKNPSGSDPTEYIYFGGQPIAEYDPTSGSWTDYIYASNGMTARATGATSSGTYYYHQDHLGSTRLITDSNGNVVSNCTYLPFGQQVSCSPDVSWNHYRFTGDEHDTETNLEHTQFRQLSSVQGRWLSPDPDLGSLDLTDPQSFNRYSYVGNNPLNEIDPDGLCGTASDPCDVTISYNGAFGGGWSGFSGGPFAAGPSFGGGGNTAGIGVGGIPLGALCWYTPCGNTKVTFPADPSGFNGSLAGVTHTVASLMRNYSNAYLNLGIANANLWRAGPPISERPAEGPGAWAMSGLLFLGDPEAGGVLNYRTVFFKAFPELEGKVIVHHAIEQQVLKRFPGLFTEAEIHSVGNLRGISRDSNPALHLSSIRREWNDFYRSVLVPSREQILQKVMEIDAKYGSYFLPPR